VVGAAADALLGDPLRGHPVALFGRAAQAAQDRVYADSRLRGAGYAAGCLLAVAGPAAVAQQLTRGRPWARAAATAAAVWAVTAARSLTTEAERMSAALESGDLTAARAILPSLCGRDPAGLCEAELARAFQRRALVMGVVAGALAIAGLVVLRADARALFDALTSGTGIVAIVASAVGGAVTLALVRAERYEPARVSAALAVAAIVAGWGIAQSPDILPGLTVHAAAASHSTLVALLISIAAGLVVLVPSLVLLFGLVLRGRFDEAPLAVEEQPARRPAIGQRSVAATAVALFVVGATLTFLGEGVVLAIGVIALAAFIVVGVAELLRPEVLE